MGRLQDGRLTVLGRRDGMILRASGRNIETIDQAPVLRLRERLLPLVSLQHLLKLGDDAPLPTQAKAANETCIVVTHFGASTFGVPRAVESTGSGSSSPAIK